MVKQLVHSLYIAAGVRLFCKKLTVARLNQVLIFLLKLSTGLSLSFSQHTRPVHQTSSALYSKFNVSSCPPWTYHRNNDSHCTCGDSINGIVLCNESHRGPWCPSSKDVPLSVCLMNCHCMSYSERFDAVIMGECPYLCTGYYHYHIPTHVKKLNTTCSTVVPQNRTGQLCGKCIEGYAPAVYSYTVKK